MDFGYSPQKPVSFSKKFTVCVFYFILESVEDVYKFGSTSISATLYDAFFLFEDSNPQADEHLRSIKKDLACAVSGCIEAAKYSMNPVLQVQLLKVLYNP